MDEPTWDQTELSVGQLAARSGVAVSALHFYELPDGRTPTRRDWQRLAQRWRAELDARIRHLQQLRDDFTDCVGCGCLSIDSCRLANPFDRLAEQGQGPRRLLDP